MLLGDLHTHSLFSYDGKGELNRMCQAAVRRGLSAIAFTEHWDALPDNHVPLPYPDGRKHYFAHDAAARRAVMDAREHYNGRLEIVYAIELGQPHTDPTSSRSFLDSHDFDFVLGAIHNTSTGLDYYFIDYSRTSPEAVFAEYSASMLRMVEFGGIDAIAHLDYPARVMRGHLPPSAPMLPYREHIEPVLKAAAQAGIALEINTNGRRNWFGRLSPEPWVLKLYRSYGGEYVTLGTDSHDVDYVAFCLHEAAELAASCGLRCARSFSGRRPVFA